LDTSKNTERLLERLDTLRYDLRIHANTVTVNLVKCKRPASRLIDDIDFEIEQGTGRLTRLQTGQFASNIQTVADTHVGEQLNILDDDWI
jgi:hypothetical protein